MFSSYVARRSRRTGSVCIICFSVFSRRSKTSIRCSMLALKIMACLFWIIQRSAITQKNVCSTGKPR
ncbi:hypothetical protein ATCV1_z439R [Acanthocystis turfacea chlorella virus 1]|uniref:Uncharacterized protein z439R n=1 Tax=Chlorovirus heliozoae TaxID=322019 RepID=A7K949_9PHYC|nr:hypothetical protein ATCV1_z439R [Acanthocystis turfacea chlorella virus 1]ABT16573.1 hypothetical protein ATCV1_z439R [Acanthocystis turfacea chlorella virus 1]